LTGIGTRLRRTWPALAVAGSASMFLPRGPIAVVLASIYAGGTVVLAIAGLRSRDLALTTAFGAPLVAAVALIAERAGAPLFGFSLSVLALTVAHFHAAGFAAALTASLVYRARHDPASAAAALSVPLGNGVVLAGFFTNAWVGLAGAIILTTGMWLVAYSTWRLTRAGGAAGDRVTRGLLTCSGAVLLGTMLLAVDWAAGRAFGVAHLSIGWMVATHGVANMLGFALCGLIAWRRAMSTTPATELDLCENDALMGAAR
jgi:hypothetical protein